MNFSPNQWAILLLVLILGWLFGLLSRSSGSRWRRAFEEERDERRALEKDSQARSLAANERIAELERYAPAITTGTAGSIAAAARGERDDLSKIRGIDHDLAIRIGEQGVHRFKQIVSLKRDQEAALEGRLGLEAGRIERERWLEQASLLARGQDAEHRTAFSAVSTD